MNYDKIIDATTNWFSVSKIFWFLLFFWLSIPVLFLVPTIVEFGFFLENLFWAVQGLYIISYISMILGFLFLTCFVLKYKNFNYQEVSLSKFVDTIFLVFVELFYIFVWNKNEKFRFTQILLILGIVLLNYYNYIVISQFIFFSLILFIVCYSIIVLINFLRISFAITIFYNKDVSILGAIEESWDLTHKKTKKVFLGFFFCLSSVVVIFLIISFILSIITNLFLVNYLTLSLSYRMAISFSGLFALAPALISYYFGFMELYSQLVSHKESSNRIKRVLSKKVLSEKKDVKKVGKKKISKKTIKKTVVKKNNIKRKSSKKK